MFPLVLRTRKFKFMVMNHSYSEQVLDWKKGFKKHKYEFPAPVFQQFCEIYLQYLQDFDIVTVPAPSFHDYTNYPIWLLAKELQKVCGFNLVNLFPEKTGRTRYGWTGSLQKTVQKIELEPRKYVLIIDDIITTGHTMRTACQSVCDQNSFPCAIAMANRWS